MIAPLYLRDCCYTYSFRGKHAAQRNLLWFYLFSILAKGFWEGDAVVLPADCPSDLFDEEEGLTVRDILTDCFSH
jgi:hypothetical protein